MPLSQAPKHRRQESLYCTFLPGEIGVDKVASMQEIVNSSYDIPVTVLWLVTDTIMKAFKPTTIDHNPYNNRLVEGIKAGTFSP